MEPVRPKKQLGQHFLKDQNIAARIASSLIGPLHSVLEIGPGTGILSGELLRMGIPDLKSIEVDREAIAYLKLTFPQLFLVEGDFLRSDLSSIFPGSFDIIGNFPYNISSQIFFKVLDHKNSVHQVVGMIQKEVAQRIATGPGSREYGILSVLLRAWYDIEYLFTVPPQVFSPPPKVTSAVIRLVRNQVTDLGCDEKLFRTVVKTGFNQRRKTLHNALKPVADYNGQFAGKRAEQLSVEDFVKLTVEISQLSAS